MSLKFCLYHQNINHTVKNSFLLPCLSNFWVSFLSNECKEHFFPFFWLLSPGRKRKLTKTLRCTIPIQKTEPLKTKHSKKNWIIQVWTISPHSGSEAVGALDRIQRGCSDSEQSWWLPPAPGIPCWVTVPSDREEKAKERQKACFWQERITKDKQGSHLTLLVSS